ncbi:septation ring formation regulator EzrA [Lactobacillus corticis]|uniref:Septation ring formation regulator EzrA n=1 Tax=Lactobacillus corticis TaxID=2201249 RepID=A0A916QKC7_9LACO|nr:septation ring formation regulator EzrA [Lactobacillus corticis]GFZ27085.1 septation ring formation regulator EzrA [Lactobacillus corticis]
MSSTETLIVIAIVLLILVVLGLGLFINRKQLHEIEAIERVLDQIQGLDLEQDINRLDQMDLAGESLTTLNTWKKRYLEIERETMPKIRNFLSMAEAELPKYRLWTSNKYLKEAQLLLEDARKGAKDTKQIFTQLLESNRENQIQYDGLITTYRAMRKDVLAKSYNYGSAIDPIEDQLAEMEKDFSQAKNLSSQGDHVEAKRVLDHLETALGDLEKQLPIVSEAEHQLDSVFQDQLAELSESYKQMISDKYYIDEIDLPQEVKNIYGEIDEANEYLKQLDIDQMTKKTDEIKNEISQLYDVLEAEYKARPFVEKNQAKMLSVLSKQQSSSKKLVDRLKHIDESYELTHGELGESKKLAHEVDEMSHQYTVDTQNIADGKAVFSKVRQSWLKMLERLHEIDEEQKAMAQNVEGLYDSENVAVESINNFKQEVSLVYRRIERRNLPGKPDSFVQMYTLVVNEIGKVSRELEQVRINMERISDELIQISDDVERLKREADDIINSANLVELTVQYANKFDDERIKRAQTEALKLYEDRYEYKEALDTIATAIEKAEPGSYQRLENTYYSETHNSN